MFGAASSPGCANFGMKYLAKENGDLYPKGSQFIMRDFYVDDGLTSAGSNEEAVQLAREACELCAMGGLRLHNFVSNERNVLESIPPSERAINVTNMDLSFDELPLERALGIQWDVESDHFRLSVSLKDQPAFFLQLPPCMILSGLWRQFCSKRRSFFRRCVGKAQAGTILFLTSSVQKGKMER